MDLDRQSLESNADTRKGDPLAVPQVSGVVGARARALAGLPAAPTGGVQLTWAFTTISVPNA